MLLKGNDGGYVWFGMPRHDAPGPAGDFYQRYKYPDVGTQTLLLEAPVFFIRDNRYSLGTAIHAISDVFSVIQSNPIGKI